MMHMISLLFFIGLTLYVGAMKADLKIYLQEIHSNVINANDDHGFERKLVTEIKFHARLYE